MNPVELAWLKVERIAGRSLSASPSDTSPREVRSCGLTEVIGTTEARLGRRMREPVTVMVRQSAALGSAMHGSMVASGASAATGAVTGGAVPAACA